MVAKTKGKKGRKAGKVYAKDEAGRAERFVDFGIKRVGKSIKAIRQIGNLSNKASYHYTEAQVTQMFDALQAQLDSVKARFSAKGKEAASEFTFAEPAKK